MSESPQQRAQRQQKIDELCAATLRALTGDAELLYRGQRLHRGTLPLSLHAPHLRTDPEHDDFADARGAADGMALRLLHSDADFHRSQCPADPVERLIFELLEQLRVEAMVPANLPGMAANLRYRFEHWSQQFHDSRLTETRLGLLLYTLAQSCWSRLNGWPPMAATEEIIDTTRAKLVRPLGVHMAGILRTRRDQKAFAIHALEIARSVASMVRAAQQQQAGERWQRDKDTRPERFALAIDFEDEEGEGGVAVQGGAGRPVDAAVPPYRVYTTRFDAEVFAPGLVREAQRRHFRERLDRRILHQGINVARLARLLGALLAEPQRDGWLFGQEEGRIDGRRLAQLVASPSERRLFRLDEIKPVADCLVTFLVDCSGSMKAYSESVATLVDVLIRVLDMTGVNSELLGFTTRAWNGGRAHQEWLQHGRPRNPGRLNEVCHMVFKTADRNWRRARTDVAALLKRDLFREGIDGEAVDWACNRMLARNESRRILVVISDGCPADSATGLANDPDYLGNHLKAVVARREQQGAVEILGLGVGLDLSPFYRRCLATDMSRTLDNALFFDIARLIGRGVRR